MRYLRYFPVFLLAVFIVSCSGGGSSTADKEDQIPQLSVEDIKKMKADPKAKNIELLKKVISTSKDKNLRKQAILALTDISLKNDSVVNTVKYLEDIAKKDKDLLSVINASLDLLRENLPEPLSVDITINAPLKAGKKVDINFLFTATKPSQIYLVLKSKILLPDKSITDNIDTDYASTFLNLEKKESKTIKFPINIKQKGIYGLKFIILQKISEFESYKYEKYILMNVKEDTGLYKVY